MRRVQALLVLLFLQRFSHLKKRNNSLGCGKLFVNFHSYKQMILTTFTGIFIALWKSKFLEFYSAILAVTLLFKDNF